MNAKPHHALLIYGLLTSCGTVVHAAPPFAERVAVNSKSAVSVFELEVNDFDNDGDLDIVTADTGSDPSAANVYYFESLGGAMPTFAESDIIWEAGFFGISDFLAADLTQDGLRDLIVAEADFIGARLIWRRNASGASPFVGSGGGNFPDLFGKFSELATADVDAADVDEDGDVDVLVALSGNGGVGYHQSSGGADPVFTFIPIDDQMGSASAVQFIDFNDDGHLDVLGSGIGKIYWYEHDGSSTPQFTRHTVVEGQVGAGNGYAADADGDGDLDVFAIVGSFNEQSRAWFENLDGDGDSWAMHVLTGPFSNRLAVADLDDDGDPDVVSAVTGAMIWHENRLGTSEGFVLHEILQEFDDTGFATKIDVGDLNGDGALDIIAGYNVGPFEGVVAWYENGAVSCSTVDVNGDGVIDGADLASLLSAWGTGGSDINGDGDTNGADLAQLLALWGPC